MYASSQTALDDSELELPFIHTTGGQTGTLNALLETKTSLLPVGGKKPALKDDIDEPICRRGTETQM